MLLKNDVMVDPSVQFLMIMTSHIPDSTLYDPVRHDFLFVVTQGTLFLCIIGFNLAQEIIAGEMAQA